MPLLRHSNMHESAISPPAHSITLALRLSTSEADMKQAPRPLHPHLPNFSLIILLTFCFLLISPPSTAAASLSVKNSPNADELMIPAETEAVYQVLEAINSEIAWRALYPGNPCMEGPHGLVCGVDEFNVLHVVELNMGWVSEANNNPQCGPNASISPAVGRFPYLRKLFFYNCFTHREMLLPSFLWNLGASLEELVFLRNTRLVGNLPADIARLANIKRLILVGNGLQGTIPTQLGELKGLIQLVLSRNDFTGEIPESLGALKKLRIVDLSWNTIEARIPSSIVSGMHRLQKLDLSHNKLTGSVPASIGEATALKLLDLSWNNLSGALPDTSLGKLNHLRVLQVGHNSFNGSDLPRAMWANLSRLVGVGMAEAGLSGRIPEAIGQLRSLRYLDLRGNKLEGAIPQSLGRLPSIFEMDLSGNQLQGVLPFSSEFVVHLGRNLRVANNEGLCSGPELNSSLLSVDAGLPVCDYHKLFSTSQSPNDGNLKLSSQNAFTRNSLASRHAGMSISSLLLAVLVLSLTITVT